MKKSESIIKEMNTLVRDLLDAGYTILPTSSAMSSTEANFEFTKDYVTKRVVRILYTTLSIDNPLSYIYTLVMYDMPIKDSFIRDQPEHVQLFRKAYYAKSLLDIVETVFDEATALEINERAANALDKRRSATRRELVARKIVPNKPINIKGFKRTKPEQITVQRTYEGYIISDGKKKLLKTFHK